MKILKNFIVYTSIICILIWNTFFSYTFAEWESNQEENKCSACNSTPASMQMLINFEVELLWILQWAWWEIKAFWTNKSSWLFAGWTFSLPEAFVKATVKKIETDFDSEIKAIRAANITAVLLGVMGAQAKDSMYSIEILRKDEAYVRDYKTLQEIDMSINDTIWDMWTAGIWNDRVSPSIKNEILWLHNKYIQLYWNDNVIFERFLVASDAKYSNILMFLLRFNSFMKSTLMALGENTPVLDASVSQLENLYSNWSVIAIINKNYIESIRMDYSCVSLSVCSKTLKQARSDLSNIKQFKQSFSRTKTTIKEANKNFKEAYWWNSNKNSSKKDKNENESKILTDKQVELLETAYWLDANKLTTSQQENIAQNFEKEMKPLKEGREDAKIIAEETRDVAYTTIKWSVQLGKYWLTTLRNWIKKIFGKWTEQEQNYINWLSEEEKQLLEREIFRQILLSKKCWLELIENMQSTIYLILAEKWKDKETILVWVNQDAHFFVEIGWLIHSIVNNEIWDKNTEWLVKVLWEICEYQCKNHGGKCYK